jgi:hypothetical protein
LVSGLALFGLMTATMNPTHAQRVADRNFVAHVASLPFLEHLALGGALFLGAAGISLGASPTRDATAFPFSRTGLARAAVALVAMGMALGFCAHRVGVEHEGFHSARGALLLIGLGLPSLVGWLGGGGIRRDYLFCAGACLVVAGLRGITWDYYYLDVVLFALFSAQVAGEDVPSRTPRRLTIAFLKKAAAVVLAITVGTQFALKLKRERDGHAGVITLCEQALRAGSISRADLSLAPFGYAGWHLYPHFVAHDGRERPDIAGFTGYLRPDALMLETRAANDRRPLASPGIILAEGEFPIRWRERHRFMLRRSNSAGQPALPWQEDPAEKDSFPLNDTEWENYIKNARLTVHPELR